MTGSSGLDQALFLSGLYSLVTAIYTDTDEGISTFLGHGSTLVSATKTYHGFKALEICYGKIIPLRDLNSLR